VHPYEGAIVRSSFGYMSYATQAVCKPYLS
jgi:hypothetical protein